MPKKPKTTQPQTPNLSQGRDYFQTPNYAVDLLVSFIPKYVKYIWEPAAGQGKIVKRLRFNHYYVFASDIDVNSKVHRLFNFLTENDKTELLPQINNSAIITNPPFSIKYKFINKALEYDVPFAFLIPFDMCQAMAKLFMMGLQGLVPTSRINYLTPNGKQGKDSSAQFHSFWLTYKFNLPQQLTFVELTKKQKENI